MSNMTGSAGGAVSNASDQAEQKAREVNDNPWFERGVRVGLVGYGIVHLLVGWLALQLAFGDRSGSPDQQGALQQIAQESYGDVLLWMIGIGLLFMAVWQVFEALWGHTSRDEPKRTIKRVGSAGKVVIYAVVGISAIKFALEAQSGGKSSTDSMTADLMKQTAGQWLVAAVGIVIIVVGVMQVKRGVTKSFTKDLKGGATSGTSGTAVERFGQVGYISKGIAIGVVGILFVWAAWDHDPKKAGGLDTALRKILDQPFGPFLLGAIALGIIAFGLYCFAWAKYADTNS
jgi:Domain of Unknown Function (DUF1206)